MFAKFQGLHTLQPTEATGSVCDFLQPGAKLVRRITDKFAVPSGDQQSWFRLSRAERKAEEE